MDFDFVREKLYGNRSDQSSDRHADIPQPGKQTLTSTQPPVTQDSDSLVREAHRVIDGARDDRERLRTLYKILEVSDRQPPEVATKLLDVVLPYANKYPELFGEISKRQERLIQTRSTAPKPLIRADALNQLKAAITTQHWDDVAHGLERLAPADFAAQIKNLSNGAHAHTHAAAIEAGNCPKVIAATTDAEILRIAGVYVEYDKAVRAARTSEVWTAVPEKLDMMGDWDINDKLKLLAYEERIYVRAAAGERTRIVEMIDLMHGTKVSHAKLIEQLDKQLAARQWGDVARRLNGLGDEDLKLYVNADGTGKLGYGQLAHIYEAGLNIGNVDRALKAIKAADPHAETIALGYRTYEDAVVDARKSKTWTTVATKLSEMGQWDIADRLGRLSREERMKVREKTQDERVLAAIMGLEGTPKDRWKALEDARLAGQWGEVAERMNGLGDDLGAYAKKLTPGERAHVVGAAPAALPGFSDRVVNAITGLVTNEKDKKDLKDLGDRYAALEQALRDAKAGGSWKEVAVRLNGSNPPDVDMYLKQLDDAELGKLEAAPISEAVRTSIAKTRAGRLDAVRTEYRNAVATGNWIRAARQLVKLPTPEMGADIDALQTRPDGLHDLATLHAAAEGEAPAVVKYIDGLGLALPTVAPPVTITIKVPDVTGDNRPLAGLSLENFGGNVAVHEFVEAIATEEAKRLDGHDKRNRGYRQIYDETFQQLREGFITTAAYVPQPTFGTYAMKWMYETREMHEASSRYEGTRADQWMNKMWGVLNTAPPVDAVLENFRGKLGHEIMVHPVVNKFYDGLTAKHVSATMLTYKGHGGEGWEPFCIDVDPNVPKDDRGFYQRSAVLDFLRTANQIIVGLGASWRGIYNDADFVAFANQDKEFANIEHDTGKVGEPNNVPRMSMTGDQGTGNWHGGLKLHVHFYIIPKTGTTLKP